VTPPSERRSQTPDELRIQQSLNACWKDGIAAQVMITIMDTYLVPFALLLGATNQQIGWLIALPNLLASLTQAWAVTVVRRSESRLTVITKGVFQQAIFLLPIGFLAFLPIPKKLLFLTLAFCIYKVIAGFLGPPWGSLVSEYLPPHRRGDYFGWRARAMGVTSIVSLVFWGTFLYFWNKMISPQSGFFVMFLLLHPSDGGFAATENRRCRFHTVDVLAAVSREQFRPIRLLCIRHHLHDPSGSALF
jgi:MFS family permease